MDAPVDRGETRNVLVSAVIIGLIIMLFSVTMLYLLTNNIYLDAYYTIETFFDNPNTASSFDLASLAFGYGSFKFWSVVFIVILDNISKLLVISFVMAAVLDIIGFANLEDVINRFKVRGLKGHVIICGYNDLSTNLVDKLKKKKISLVVVDSSPNMPAEMAKQKVISISGKFTERENLEAAGIANASTVVFSSWNDLDNLLGAVTARKMNKNAKIMSKVSSEEASIKMHRLGVEICVLPEYLAGIELGEELGKIVSRR